MTKKEQKIIDYAKTEIEPILFDMGFIKFDPYGQDTILGYKTEIDTKIFVIYITPSQLSISYGNEITNQHLLLKLWLTASKRGESYPIEEAWAKMKNFLLGDDNEL